MAILVSLLVLLFASLELTSTLIAHENIIDSAPGTAVYFLVEHTGSGISSIIWKFNTSTVIVQVLGGSTMYYGAYKDRAKLFTNNATLRLDRVTHEDSGVYEVQVTDDNGSASSAKITLQIYRPPLGQIACNAEVREDQVNLSCIWAGGIPQTTIELKVGSTSLNGLNEQYYTIAKTDSNLPIDLQCIGQYAMSTQTCRLTLDKPKLSAPTGNKITAGLNADVRLLLLQMKRARRFSATELLPTTFTWSKADTPTIVSGNKFSITSNNTFSQLIIMRFQKADEGTYTCLARNSIGQKAFQFEVYSGNGAVNVGLIAGATVGTSAGVTIFLVAAFYIRKKKRESLNDDALKLNQSHKSQSEDVPPDACRDVKILDGSTSEDGAQVVYAQVKILKKKEKTAVDPADPYAKVDKSTKHRNTGVPDVVYSQVKISKKAENEGNN